MPEVGSCSAVFYTVFWLFAQHFQHLLWKMEKTTIKNVFLVCTYAQESHFKRVGLLHKRTHAKKTFLIVFLVFFNMAQASKVDFKINQHCLAMYLSTWQKRTVH